MRYIAVGLDFDCQIIGMQLLTQELAEEGYAGVEVRVTPLRTEIIISATRPQNVLGEKGQRIRELTSVVQKRSVNAFDHETSPGRLDRNQISLFDTVTPSQVQLP